MSELTKEPYFSSSCATVWWDEESQSVAIQWRHFAFSPDFRQAMDKIVELLVLKKASQVLSDSSKQSVIALDDQDWSNQDWAPRALKAGYRRIAIVMPQNNIITQMSLKRVMKNVQHFQLETDYDYFNTIEEARTWLKDKAKSSELAI